MLALSVFKLRDACSKVLSKLLASVLILRCPSIIFPEISSRKMSTTLTRYNLRTNQSLFSLNSRVSRKGTFGTNLGVYRSNLSYKSFWSTILSHLLLRKKVLKKIRSLHNGAKSLPLKKLQRQEKIIFGTEIGAIT